METIESGSELCDGFFNELLKDSDIDPSIAEMLHELHEGGTLTKESILEGLEALRQHAEEDHKD